MTRPTWLDCDHTGIGLPGCPTCDGREDPHEFRSYIREARDYIRELEAALAQPIRADVAWSEDGEVLSLRVQAPGQASPWPCPWLAQVQAVGEEGHAGFEVCLFEWGNWSGEHEPLDTIKVRDANEGRRMVAAVLGVRGIVVPEWKP